MAAPSLELPLRKIAVAAAVLVSALALAGCQGKVSRPACPAGQQCFEEGVEIEPLTLDPHKSNLVPEARVIGDMLMGLTTEDPAANPIPGAAVSWETSADGLVWTFHLRPGAKWSDGVPVTADDFVYSARRLLDPKTASIYAYLAYVLKGGQAVNEGKAPVESLGVRAVDPLTVEYTLEHPAPYLPQLAMHTSFYPVPKHVVEKYGDAWVQPGRYVANGAYKPVAWRLGDHIEAVKNPLFYDAANVCFSRVNYYPTPDAISAERRVQRGELDANTAFQSNRLARLRKVMPGYPRPHVSLATAYISFNTRDVKALQDIRVRRALSMAIDRDFITQKLQRAGQQPAYSFVTPGTANYVSDFPRLRWSNLTYPQRQAEAKRLLAEAGFGPEHPLKIELKVANSSETMLLTEAIQADWRSIGVDPRIVQEEGQIAFADYRQRSFDAGFMSWYADFNDPVTFLGLLKSDTGAQNYGDYKNPAYDALLAAADNEPDIAKRARLLAQAEQRLLDDEGVTPIYFLVNRALVNPNITGWVDNALTWHRARWLCRKS